MSDRLKKSDWIEHGLNTLATVGARGLKVGIMATELNVSRGSFYWHFRDIDDFRSELLRRWQEQSTDLIISRLEAENDQPARLKPLLRGAFVERPRDDPVTGPWAAEAAIRSWSEEDDDVAGVVAALDQRRVAYIATLLVAAGVHTERASSRAAFLYWAYLGHSMIPKVSSSSITLESIDDISDLFSKGDEAT